jgi:alkylation response protein AidB-like acyl-CoA dehydrogenase
VSSTLPDLTRSHHPPAHHPPAPGDGLPAGDAEPQAGDVEAEVPARAADAVGGTPVAADVAAGSGLGAAGGAAVAGIMAQLRAMLEAGDLDLPRPGAGATAHRWAALADWGTRDLSLARLAEGHVDALAILAEAGRAPAPGALYGVWASRSGGAAVRLERRGRSRVLAGSMRFCSGARVLDRALVVADPPSGQPAGGRLLVDVDVTVSGVAPLPDTWCTAAMAAADTLDVEFDDVPVTDDDLVGEPGWYVARPGFALGGAGVAAVWWGGAAGVLDRVLRHLRPDPDAHQLAHVGELHAALAAADALLGQTAAAVDADPAADHGLAVATVRAAVERAAREVVDRAPRIVGPAPLSRDPELARALADLGLYVRQHHAERDHAALGGQVVDRWRTA